MKNINLQCPVLRLWFLLYLGAIITTTSAVTPTTNENTNTLPRSFEPYYSLYPRAMKISEFQPGALVKSTLHSSPSEELGHSSPSEKLGHSSPSEELGMVMSVTDSASSPAPATSTPLSQASTGTNQGPGVQVHLYKPGKTGTTLFFPAEPGGTVPHLSLIESPLKKGDKVLYIGLPNASKFKERRGTTGVLAADATLSKMTLGNYRVTIKWDSDQTMTTIQGHRTSFKRSTT